MSQFDLDDGADSNVDESHVIMTREPPSVDAQRIACRFAWGAEPPRCFAFVRIDASCKGIVGKNSLSFRKASKSERLAHDFGIAK